MKATRISLKTLMVAALRAAPVLLPILLVALLLPLFFFQAIGPARTGQYPYSWQADWIGSPYPGEPTACFRKVVDVTGTVETAYLAVSADNFYMLQVNGRTVQPFFASAADRTWIVDQTLYNCLGYPRNNASARLYNIEPFLRTGRNVISVKVQSDEKTPRLAVQGAVETAVQRTAITSDGTWTCAPREQTVAGVSWTLPQFTDGNWDAAIPAERVQIPLDGNADVFENRMQGTFLRPDGLPQRADYRFRGTFETTSRSTGGWLRVSTNSDYDLFVDGVPVTDLAQTGRSSENRLAGVVDNDTFVRVRPLDLTPSLLPGAPGTRTDIYQLNGELPAGHNRIEVVVHPSVLSGDINLPIVFVEGSFAERGGNNVNVQNSTVWESQHATDGGETAWTPCPASSVADARYAAAAQWQYGGDFDPSLYRDLERAGFSSAALIAILLLATMLVSRFRPRVTDATDETHAVQAWGEIRRLAGWCVPAAVVFAAGLFVSTLVSPVAPDIGPWRPEHAAYVLIAAVAATILPFGLSRLASPIRLSRSQSDASGNSTTPGLRELLQRHGHEIALAVIVIVSAVFCFTHLGADAYGVDEYVSIYASDGVVHHGIPIYPQTGIVYTRSSLFHYLLALFMALGGGAHNPMSTRLLACLYQLGTIVAAYFLAKETSGKKAGLLAAVLVAFSPYAIFYARYARFYAQFQFFVTLVFYLLLRSVRNPERHWYRPAAILAFCGAYLSQQFAIVVVPSALAILLLSGQLHTWFNKRTVPWLLFGIAVMAADYIAYNRFSVTPRPYIDVETVTLLSLHTDILEVLPGMLFLNQEHCQAVTAVFYVLGLTVFTPWGWMRQADGFGKGSAESPATATTPRTWHWWSYLYLASGPTVFLTALLAPRPASRYIVDAAALVIVTAACAAVHLLRGLSRWSFNTSRSAGVARAVRWTSAAVLAIAILLTYRPIRLWAGVHRNITVNNTDAARFIALNRQPGDAVVFRSPEVALVELGKCDYVWRPKRGSIFMYMDKNRRIRERDSGAIMIDSVDKMRHAMLTNPRLWIVVPSPELISPGTLQSGDLVRFVRQNFKVADEPLGVEVFLWDRRWGHLQDAPHKGYEGLAD